jgi:hypothetical protein
MSKLTLHPKTGDRDPEVHRVLMKVFARQVVQRARRLLPASVRRHARRDVRLTGRTHGDHTPT